MQKVLDKYGNVIIAKAATDNKFADRARKMAGIKIYDEVKLAKGKTHVQLLIEKNEGAKLGMKMSRDSDKDLLLEN